MACIQEENAKTNFSGNGTNTSDENSVQTIDELAREIKNAPEDFLYPYDGLSYDTIAVNVESGRVIVKATSEEVPGEDVYMFVYENGTLVLKSYLLEAIPPSVREQAIAIALSNRTVYENADGHITVRRVLPHTAAKFYIPKELFSVTWHGDRIVSALVDLEEGTVVKTYLSG
ncbi:hypothetical protein GAH_01730 [Geoglobus ahangari]|uniref:Uncharacterized protein n=2 Tax=Geoglobus ahangari TaxID=113653 RepID=A0A0F7IGF3_9EURY|nr:hypothetical protein GAH_01730 [Geoglobus ahangari]